MFTRDRTSEMNDKFWWKVHVTLPRCAILEKPYMILTRDFKFNPYREVHTYIHRYLLYISRISPKRDWELLLGALSNKPTCGLAVLVLIPTCVCLSGLTTCSALVSI
uniref:Uncharacterized protein n=1 Tax=Cacopsylla melanoneura TaxID=428564 RepID=A0A8D8QYF4_9HEMI